MSSTLYNSLIRKKIPYNEKLIRRSIIVSRYSTSKRTLDKHKMFIYDSLSTIIVKNVNNFFVLIKNVEKQYVLHEKDDIVLECFIILDKCIENFNVRLQDTKFFFYLNKSLSLGLYRLKKKAYDRKSVFTTVDFSQVQNYENLTFTSINTHPLFLSSNFTDKEILLMHSKINEEKIKDFCDKTEISRNEYYKLINNIKKKIDKKYF